MTRNDQGAEPYQHIGILGAGAWGTALAVVAARAGRSVILWARDPTLAESMALKRENARFLSGVEPPSGIELTEAQLGQASGGATAFKTSLKITG